MRALPKKNRGLIEFLTLGVTLVVSLFSTAVVWIVLWRQVTLELVLLLLSAWFVTVVAGLIELKRPAAERVSAAGRERQMLRDGAKKFGFMERTITRRQRVEVEAVYWLTPLVGLPLLGGVGLVWDFGGDPVDNRAWALLFILGLGAGLMAVGWRSTAPLPPYKLSDRAFSWIVRGVGLFLMVLVSLGAFLAESQWFTALSALSIVVAAALYLAPAVASRFPFMKTIRDAATTKRLVQADEWYARMMQELDDEQEREPSIALREAGPEPMIRIEVFRRRAKRQR